VFQIMEAFMHSPKPILLLACLILGLPAFPVSAQAGRWERIGPEGGVVYRLAASPSRPGIVYAGLGSGGVYRSSDRGITWVYAGRGLETGGSVDALGVDATSARTVYAAQGELFKTEDSGASWRPVDLGTAGRVTGLAVDPRRSGRLYVILDVRRVLRSTDGGQTWTELPAGWSRSVTRLWIDPLNPDVLYAGTSEESLFKSTDGGGRWSAISQGLDPRRGVLDLAIDPASRTLYLAQDYYPERSLFKSTDGGARWTVLRPPGNRSATSVAVAGEKQPVLLVVSEEGTLVRSENGGRTWKETELPAWVYEIMPTPYGFLAGTGTGVFRSEDRGVSWTLSRQGLTATRISGLALDPEHALLYAVAERLGLFQGRDGFTNGGIPSWKLLHDGLREPVVLAPARPATVYATFTKGVGRSMDSGRIWRLRRSLLEGIFLRTIAVDALRPETVYAGGSSNIRLGVLCSILRSDDGGVSWRCLSGEGFPFPPFTWLIVADPVRTGVVYAESGARLYKSEDSGASWARLPLEAWPSALAIDPTNPSRLWAGVPGGLARSEDGGQTWDLRLGGLLEDQYVVALAVDPVETSTLYVATRREGVLKSTDAGETLVPLGAGLEDLWLTTLVLDPVDRDTLYVGTTGAGVMRLRQRAGAP
jgi:photosystem II stability/assembly factor-like uncharacterized protein